MDHVNSESWTSPRRVVQKFHVHFIGMVYDSMSKEIQSLLSWMCQRVLKFAHPLLILLSAKHRVAYRNFLWECEECMWNSFPHSHESFAGMCWKCTMAWRVLNSAWCWIYFLFLLVLIFSWHCADTDTVYLPKSKICPKKISVNCYYVYIINNMKMAKFKKYHGYFILLNSACLNQSLIAVYIIFHICDN